MDETSAEPLLIDVEALAGELVAAVAAEPPRLDRVGLAIAQLGDAPVDDDAVLATLDGWGGKVAEASGGSPAAGWDALERLLVGEVGLHGDEEDYEDPRNSFLPDVLARRRGLPILLSLVWLEVARRAGLPLHGLALPGHFVVGYRVGVGGLVVIDPFRRGRILDRGELEALVARSGAAWSPAVLAPAPAPAIAARMLRNLVGSFQRRNRRDRVRAAAALVLALEPRDRGALAALALAGDDHDN
jgi:hypothetical protein